MTEAPFAIFVHHIELWMIDDKVIFAVVFGSTVVFDWNRLQNMSIAVDANDRLIRDGSKYL